MASSYLWFEQYKFYVPRKEMQEAIHRKMYTIPLEKIKQLGKKILEVGVGPGLESLILQHDGFDVVATDVDANIPSRILVPMGLEKIARCDAAELPFPDKCFDIVFSSGLIEHFTDEEILKMLQEQLRVAKYAYFEVPLLELRVITPHLWEQGEHWFTVEEWLDKMAKMGFTVHEITMREWKTLLGVVLC